jgi:hypothetical protein
MSTWGLPGAEGSGITEEMLKVAFQSIEEYITGLLKKGIPLEEELPPLFMESKNSPKYCPYKISNITYPQKDTFTVDIDDQARQSVKDRLYVEDIDSFKKVRDVNPAMVSHLLRSGFLAISEDQVQIALEEILNVPFHRKDWGGEINDLYTANVVVNGERRATAFLLKGPGIGKKVMEIADCGKRGDQIVRLFDTPADLFVVQYVGPIADLLIKDVQAKVANLRASGKEANFLIMDGQDTARVLHAYGKLQGVGDGWPKYGA